MKAGRYKQFAFLAALLLASCLPSQGGDVSDANYYTGTDGLVVRFLGDAPPETVYEDSEFPVIMEFLNAGASPITLYSEGNEPAASVVLNFDPFYIEYAEGVTENDVNRYVEDTFKSMEVLEGKSDFFPEGQGGVLGLGRLKAKKILGQRRSPETQIYASVCYPYVTTLATDICMDSTMQQRNLRQQACKATDKSLEGGQGAPVEITLVEVDMIPVGQLTRPSFVVHISNSGPGTVVRAITPETPGEEVCQLHPGERKDINTIYVTGMVGNVPLECEPNPFRLVGQTTKFFCIVPNEELVAEENRRFFNRQDNFITTLQLNLSYAYATNAVQKVEIKRRLDEILTETITDQGGSGCMPHQDEPVEGTCVNRCGNTEETAGFVCACDREKCTDMYARGTCTFADGLCPTGSYCCKFTCDLFHNREEECTGDRETINCFYCDRTRKCVEDSCEACEYDREGYHVEEEEKVCKLVKDQESEEGESEQS